MGFHFTPKLRNRQQIAQIHPTDLTKIPLFGDNLEGSIRLILQKGKNNTQKAKKGCLRGFLRI